MRFAIVILAGLFCGFVLGATNQTPQPCNAAGQSWYSGGADLYANNPFVKGAK